MATLIRNQKQTVAGVPSRFLDVWAPKEILARLVLQVAKAARRTQLCDAGQLVGTQMDDNEITLAILVYCYAIGIYRSREIERRILRAKAARESCPYALPDCGTLAHFCRDNRELIKRCLMSVLKQSFRVRRHTAATADASRYETGLSVMESHSDCSFFHLLDAEAERRIAIAVEFDSLEQVS